MSELKQKLESAKRWLLSAVPTSTGRADSNPLYVILSELISELEEIKSRLKMVERGVIKNASRGAQLEEKEDQPATKTAEIKRLMDEVQQLQDCKQKIKEHEEKLTQQATTLMNLEWKITQLTNRLDGLSNQIERSFSELVKMITEE